MSQVKASQEFSLTLNFNLFFTKNIYTQLFSRDYAMGFRNALPDINRRGESRGQPARRTRLWQEGKFGAPR